MPEIDTRIALLTQPVGTSFLLIFRKIGHHSYRTRLHALSSGSGISSDH